MNVELITKEDLNQLKRELIQELTELIGKNTMGWQDSNLRRNNLR